MKPDDLIELIQKSFRLIQARRTFLIHEFILEGNDTPPCSLATTHLHGV